MSSKAELVRILQHTSTELVDEIASDEFIGLDEIADEFLARHAGELAAEGAICRCHHTPATVARQDGAES